MERYLVGLTPPNCHVLVMLMQLQEWFANSGYIGFILAFCDRPSSSPDPSHCIHISKL
jgi:hypothetical protein